MVIQWHFLNNKQIPVFSGKYFVNSCYNSTGGTIFIFYMINME